jgi:hypothetical protein
MKRIVKRTFVPHKDTNPRPLFWHPVSISFFVLAILFLSGFLALQKNEQPDKGTLLGDIQSGVIIAFTNKERSKVNAPTLSVSETLNQAATLKAQDMAQNEYFAHYSPSGISPWHWFTKVGYEYQKAGENLAVNFKDSKDVVTAWMNSPTHKENIIKEGYTEIGIGTAEGMHKGKKATYVVQLFASPKTEASTLAFSIEKKNPLTVDTQVSVQGAEISVITLASISQLFISPTYTFMLLLALFSFIIIVALTTLVIRWRHHTSKFYLSIVVLLLVLFISIYTQISFLKEITIRLF